MRRLLLASTFLLFLTAPLCGQNAPAPPMVCPGAAEATSCSLYHFHVQVWRPDTKAPSQELTGVNQFASMDACDAARTEAVNRNQEVVDFIRRAENNVTYQPSRFGPCHCDMTALTGTALFLDQPQRAAQLRMREEIAGKVRERLLDRGAPPDSSLMRGTGTLPRSATSAWPVVQPTLEVGRPAPAAPLGEGEIKDTPAAMEGLRPGEAADGLALADVPTPAANPVTRMVTPATVASNPPSETPATPADTSGKIDIHFTPKTPANASGSQAASSSVTVEEPEANEDDDSLDRLIAYETARVQAVLRAAAAVPDDALKRKIFEASNERLQLLSNFRALVEGAGSKSRLAGAVRAVKDEQGRLGLATKLFGKSIVDHWSPKDARDIIVDASADITDDPTAVLRDSAGRFTEEQKKLALYFLLARSSSMSPTQELWLTSIVEGSL